MDGGGGAEVEGSGWALVARSVFAWGLGAAAWEAYRRILQLSPKMRAVGGAYNEGGTKMNGWVGNGSLSDESRIRGEMPLTTLGRRNERRRPAPPSARAN